MSFDPEKFPFLIKFVISIFIAICLIALLNLGIKIYMKYFWERPIVWKRISPSGQSPLRYPESFEEEEKDKNQSPFPKNWPQR